MTERRDPHPVMTQLISDSDRVGASVAASLLETRPLETPYYLRFDELLESAPFWFAEREGQPLKELQRLNSNELWQGLFNGVEFDSIALFDERLLQRLSVNMKNDQAIRTIQSVSTDEGFSYVLPLFGLAALMGRNAYRYIEVKVNNRIIGGPVIDPATEAGIRFDTKAETPDEFIERMKKLFPPKIKHGDGSAMDLLVEMQAFRRKSDPTRFCPAPRLVMMLLESFGRELEDGYDQRLVGLALIDPSQQVR